MAAQPIKNAIISSDQLSFRVLERFVVEPPAPLWWTADDIEEPEARGIVFRGFLAESPIERAQLIVADVTKDSSEPSIRALDADDVAELDKTLLRETTVAIELQGCTMVRWMNSHLNESSIGRGLVTAYIKNDPGCGDRQVITLRIALGDTKFVVEGCFNVLDADLLARPIFDALRRVAVL